MKNKKLFTRISALLASLVLLFALAVPCFAAEPVTNPATYVTKQITFTDRSALYAWLTENIDVMTGFVFSTVAFPLPVVMNVWNALSGTAPEYSISQLVGIANNQNDTESGSDIKVTNIIITDSDVQLLNSVPIKADPMANAYSIIPDEMWDDMEIVVVVNYLEEFYGSSDDTPPTRSGMFGQLYNILRDAIFGENAVLDNNQDYALTLLSTVMTYCTVLVPVIVAIAIAVWCFKRF